MNVQATLPLAPSLTEATELGERAMKAAWEHADEAWAAAVRTEILRLPWAAQFIAEDVVLAVAGKGFTTSNAKAVGAIIKTLSRQGFIRSTGNARRARTSHGSFKPVWART